MIFANEMDNPFLVFPLPARRDRKRKRALGDTDGNSDADGEALVISISREEPDVSVL